MGVFNAMIPIAPGNAAQARELARTTQGERAAEFAEWFRAQVKDIAGADLATLLGGVQPELILDWARG